MRVGVSWRVGCEYADRLAWRASAREKHGTQTFLCHFSQTRFCCIVKKMLTVSYWVITENSLHIFISHNLMFRRLFGTWIDCSIDNITHRHRKPFRRFVAAAPAVSGSFNSLYHSIQPHDECRAWRTASHRRRIDAVPSANVQTHPQNATGVNVPPVVLCAQICRAAVSRPRWQWQVEVHARQFSNAEP